MTKETKAKLGMYWGKFKRAVKAAALPMFVGGTVGAAWGGYIAAFRHNKDIAELKANLRGTNDVVTHNARVQQYDQQRLSELERQQNMLFERALKETEGEKAS